MRVVWRLCCSGLSPSNPVVFGYIAQKHLSSEAVSKGAFLSQKYEFVTDRAHYTCFSQTRRLITSTSFLYSFRCPNWSLLLTWHTYPLCVLSSWNRSERCTPELEHTLEVRWTLIPMFNVCPRSTGIPCCLEVHITPLCFYVRPTLVPVLLCVCFVLLVFLCVCFLCFFANSEKSEEDFCFYKKGEMQK